jgi:hypothetical protein
MGQITDVYDPGSGTWISFKFSNYDRISQLSHIEPERFKSNFNELCGCVPLLGGYAFVPETYETVTIK